MKVLTKPLFISTMAATGCEKLKIMLTNESDFIRTKVDVIKIRDHIFKSRV